MKFPDRDRVIYTSNPLQEVICQIRFPRVLEIESRLPVDFQKTAGQRYPLLETREAVRIEISKGETTERAVVYEFVSTDHRWKLSLASDFIAVSTQDYIRWEEFREHLASSLEYLFRHYTPAIFLRIGLRYANLIDRKKLGLDQLSWHEAIRPSLVGILSEPVIPAADVAELTGTIGVRLNEGFVTVRHGLIQPSELDHTVYLIDSDFYTEKPTPADAKDALRLADEFNAESGRVFRWCIGDRLHDALGPKPVESA
jgi:uncharacterized protein (TIGR04255 family)